MMLQEVGKLRNIITHNIVWANQNTKSFVYPWLRTLAMFDVMCFPAFVGASDVNCNFVDLPSYNVFVSLSFVSFEKKAKM